MLQPNEVKYYILTAHSIEEMEKKVDAAFKQGHATHGNLQWISAKGIWVKEMVMSRFEYTAGVIDN